MPSADRTSEPSLTPTILDHSTSLEAGFESDGRPTVRKVDFPDESPKRPGPASGFAPMSTPPFDSPESNIVTWDGPDDPDNPRNWSYTYKWFVTFICSLLTLNVYVSFPLRRCICINSPCYLYSTFASSAPSGATHVIAKELKSPTETSYLIISMFLVGYLFGPMFWGPGSELIGRRPILIFSLSLYSIFHLGQALAQNMLTIVLTRFFAGFFACAPLTTSGGVFADIWDPVNRGVATSVFAANVFLGPVLGPVIGG